MLNMVGGSLRRVSAFNIGTNGMEGRVGPSVDVAGFMQLILVSLLAVPMITHDVVAAWMALRHWQRASNSLSEGDCTLAAR